jgi:hypothetical protein
MAGINNFEIDQGATWVRDVIWKAGSPAVVVDITGYTARMYLKRSYRDSTAALELTTENGRIAITGVEGKTTLTLTAAETAALSGQYVYDLELLRSVGVVKRLVQGVITMNAEVTR